MKEHRTERALANVALKLFDEAVVYRIQHEVKAPFHSHFLQDAAAMRADRLDADIDLLRDLRR